VKTIEQDAIIVGPRIIKGRAHCANCGRYTGGNVFVELGGLGDRFVCNVRCGMDFAIKRDFRMDKTGSVTVKADSYKSTHSKDNK
jgi:hypothetical protein